MRRLLLVFIFLSSSLIANDPKIHALIFVNNAEKKIGKPATKDGLKIKSLIEKLSKGSNLKAKIEYWDDDKANLKNMRTWIEKVPKADILFLYYTGHGLGKHWDAFKWPIMVDQKKNMLCGSDILKSVGEDRRTSIVILDCCNCYTDDIVECMYKRQFDHKKIPHFASRKLLYEFKGKVMVCSSSPGQSSYCCRDGSIFTNALLESIMNMREGSTWRNVLEDSGLHCLNSYGKQAPLFEIVEK